MKRIAILGLFSLGLLPGVGCSKGAPVSQVAHIELKAASERPADGMVPMLLFGTDREIYVGDELLMTNADISTVERSYDTQGDPAISLRFTDDGGEKISKFTRSGPDRMIALVIDGQLMLALPVQWEIRSAAMISGGMSQMEIDRLYTMLTATEVHDAGRGTTRI